jgi:hypothetical protein
MVALSFDDNAASLDASQAAMHAHDCAGSNKRPAE